MTAIPSTPPMGIPRSNHPSRSGSPTKAGSAPGGYLPPGSPVPPMPPPSYESIGANVTNNVANFVGGTFSKLTSGSSDIQGSIGKSKFEFRVLPLDGAWGFFQPQFCPL